MKRTILIISLTIIAVLLALILLPTLLPTRHLVVYSDEELRVAALSRGMLSVPKDFDALIKIKNNSAVSLTPQMIALGKELYFDPLLSKNKTTSCATCHTISKNHDSHVLLKELSHASEAKSNCISCHLRDESGTDRLQSAVGDNGAQNPLRLNTPTILNSSLAKYLAWDGSVHTVEEEVGRSLHSPFKLNITASMLEQRLHANPHYLQKFNAVFKNGPHQYGDAISVKNTQKAIGAYVRTLLTRSAYDRFLDGNNSAIDAEAKKGLANFINFGCKGCHTGMSVGGQVIEKFPLKDYASIEDIGFNTPVVSSGEHFPFNNIGGFLGKNDDHLFRVPILRNVTKTSPYFHNGSVPKLREAIAIMGKYQLGLNLNETQIDELIAFLKTLDGEIVEYNITRSIP